MTPRKFTQPSLSILLSSDAKVKTCTNLGWRGTGVERAPARVHSSGKEAGETDRENGRGRRSGQDLISVCAVPFYYWEGEFAFFG